MSGGTFLVVASHYIADYILYMCTISIICGGSGDFAYYSAKCE